MDKMTEKKVKECYPGQVIGKNVSPGELRSMPLPDKPCSYVAVNLLGVSEMNYLLVIVMLHIG